MRRAVFATVMTSALLLTAPAADAAPVPTWTATSLAQLVASSLQSSALPDAMNPSLPSALAIATSTRRVNQYVARESACDPLRHPQYARSPKPCFFGDTTSRRTLAIFGGGSNFAWTWALNAPLKRRGIRIALFEFSGCSSADVTASPTLFPQAWRNCNAWHAALPRAIDALRPFAVLTSSGAYESPTTDEEWVAAYAKEIHLITAGIPRAKVVLLGSTPILRRSVPRCVAAHQQDLQACTFDEASIINDPKTSNGSNGEAFTRIVARDAAVALASGATLIKSEPWLCSSGRCPVVIGDYLAYRDDRHFFYPFLEALGPVVDAALHQSKIY